MRKKKTQFVILGLLSEGNLSGYEMKKIIDIRFGFFWNESYGQIFPELKLLEKQNFIEVVISETDSKRDKITYAITQKGINALKNWICEPVEKESVRYEILLKMYFSGLVDREVMKRHLEDFLSVHQMQLGILKMFTDELVNMKDTHSNHGDVLRVINFGKKVNEAYINWCNETINYLESGNNK